MEDSEFRELFQRLAEQYALPPDMAEELLRRILAILSRRDAPDE